MGMMIFLLGCLLILLGLLRQAERKIKAQAAVLSACAVWCCRLLALSLCLRFLPWYSLYPKELRLLLMLTSSLSLLFYVSFFLYQLVVWGYHSFHTKRRKPQSEKAVAKGQRKRIWPAGFLVSMLCAFVLLGIGSMQAMRLQVRKETVAMAITKPVKLLFISDLHMGTAFSFPASALQQAAQGCDGVLLGGDVYDEATSTADMQVLCGFLNELHLPVYYAPGNHEALQRHHAVYDEMLREAHVQFLEDKLVELHGIQLLGRRDAKEKVRASFAQLQHQLKKEEPLLVLDHRPQREHTHRIALQLSGHTHDGQLFPNNLLVKIPYPEARKRTDDPYVMLVSSGSGTWGFPLRIGSVSEVIVLTLVPQGSI